MKKLHIIHLGIGNVGKQVVKQILENNNAFENELGVSLVYCGLFTSKKFHANPKGFSRIELLRILSSFSDNARAYSGDREILDFISRINLPFVTIDTTPSDKTVPVLLQTLQQGGYVVMSNKKPLCSAQKEFDALHKLGGQRLFYETTVGAALPVVKTLKNLLSTGDEIVEIKACVSGTLGFIFSQLDSGVSFSEAILQAREKGYTEPDPRDDLSGTDVARKALILSRILGKKISMEEVKVENLYPKSMNQLSIDEFMQDVHTLNTQYGNRLKEAKQKKKKLRFVALVNGKSSASIQMVDENDSFGSLTGPDNLFEFKTKRYNKYPLVIKGPGAGAEITASGVIGDILHAAKDTSEL